MVNAVAHIDIKPPSLTKQGFVAGTGARLAMKRQQLSSAATTRLAAIPVAWAR